MAALVRRLLGDQRVRFLLIGAINTVIGYGLFALFMLAIGATIGYFGSLYASYAIATVIAFILHRRFTFRADKSGNAILDFLRFQSVYIVALTVNTIALPLLVEWARVPPLVAQAVIVIATTVISYFGHKWFSFRRPRVDASQER